MESTCSILQKTEEPFIEITEELESDNIIASIYMLQQSVSALPQHEVNTSVQSIYNFEPYPQNIFSSKLNEEENFAFESIINNGIKHPKRKRKSKNTPKIVSKLEKPKCEICSLTFRSEYNYKRHLLKHTHNGKIECNICQKSIRKNRFLDHVLVHTGEKPHICEICGRGFRQARDLKQHCFTHTGEKPYSCQICGKRFSDSSSRRKHLQLHTGEKPYSCEICDKSFTQLSHLREHQVTHTKNKQHDCEICQKKFTTKSSVQRHLLTHTNSCDVCGETFKTVFTLERHKELHSVDRPYSCEHCTRRFLKRADLTTHMVLHTDEKTISCNICGDLFKCHRHFRLHHQQSHLVMERPFICQICKKGFFIETSLKKHSFVHNPERRVKHKKKVAATTINLKEKPVIVNGLFHYCSMCEKRYRHKQDLYRHIRICHREVISQNVDSKSIVKREC